MTTPAHTAADVVTFVALAARQRLDYAITTLAHHPDPQLAPLAAELHHLLAAILDTAAPFFTERYSDGRDVVSRVELPGDHPFTHIWHPDPEADEPQSIEYRTPYGAFLITAHPPGTLLVTELPATTDGGEARP